MRISDDKDNVSFSSQDDLSPPPLTPLTEEKSNNSTVHTAEHLVKEIAKMETSDNLSNITPTAVTAQTAGTTSMGISIVNLVKNIIGTSMVSMSYGVACSGVVPSLIICFVFALVSAYTFGLLGRMCADTGADSYKNLCERVLHPKIGVYIDALLALYTLPACIAYAIFVCDCMTKMVGEMNPALIGTFLGSRAFIAIILTFGILIPLCSMSSLDRLTFTSVLGVGAIAYLYIFVAVDLSQNNDSASANLSGALWAPPSGSLIGLFPMANIYAACYLVQYNSPKFFFALRKPTARRFYTLSFATNILVAFIVGSFAVLGFARFGISVSENLLVGYSGTYPVWIATCVSLITTYPFVFDAGRRSVMSVMRGRSRFTEKQVFWGCTLILIPLFSFVAVLVSSISLVIGLNGSVFGVIVGFTLPGYLLATKARKDQQGGAVTVGEMKKCRNMKIVGYVLVGFGIFLTTLGLVSIFLNVSPTKSA